jgi:hypothetical protein
MVVSKVGLLECWVLGGSFFFTQKLLNSKKLRLIIHNQGLIYLPIENIPGLFEPMTENSALSENSDFLPSEQWKTNFFLKLTQYITNWTL